MKIKTTAWSFLESRWKQVVNISSSSACWHFGRLYSIQNLRLQSLQLRALFILSPLSSLTRARSSLPLKSLDWDCRFGGPSSIIVLFEKQVHLQNDVGFDANMAGMQDRRSRKHTRCRFTLRSTIMTRTRTFWGFRVTYCGRCNSWANWATTLTICTISFRFFTVFICTIWVTCS